MSYQARDKEGELLVCRSCVSLLTGCLCLAVGCDGSAGESSNQPSAGAEARKLRGRTDGHHCDRAVCSAQSCGKASDQLSGQFCP